MSPVNLIIEVFYPGEEKKKLLQCETALVFALQRIGHNVLILFTF